MLRRALFVTPLFLLGCASAPTSPSIAVPTDAVSALDAPPVDVLVGPDAATGAFTGSALDPQRQAATSQPRPRQRFTLKSGYYSSSDDGLDDGYIILGSWMRPASGAFSTEVEIGYLDADGSDNGVDRDVWAIPFLAGGRFTIPVGQKIELYAGLGLGSFYYDAEVQTPGVSVKTDGFLLAGDGYFGGDIQLGESAYVGLEGKYYVTDNTSELGGGLDAYVVMLTLGFAR